MHCKHCQFKEGDTVYVKSFSEKEDWLPKVQGPLTYLVELEDERVVRRHVDYVKLRVSLVEPINEQSSEVEDLLPPPASKVPETPRSINTEAELPATTQRPVRTHKRPSRL